MSNDELLEILSETKDPLRVQPHLKKCFEGIHKLEFTDQQEIVGMISAEKETVPFITKIFPAKAKVDYFSLMNFLYQNFRLLVWEYFGLCFKPLYRSNSCFLPLKHHLCLKNLFACTCMCVCVLLCGPQGMVEKWLLQVEDTMISSVRKVVLDSIQAYRDSPRKRWVIEWPGQVTLCVSSIFWTFEVTQAMSEPDGMQVK